MFRSIGCDGLEILTGYDFPPELYAGEAVTVHLPYAPCWLTAWDNDSPDMDDDSALYFTYGRCREDVVHNVSRSIEYAARLNPGHGVFHACNADVEEVFHHRYTRSDSYVVDAVCDLMNEVMGGEEPPFTIAFENLWWPGLRLLDDSGFRMLERKLEFDDWGFCLDTGHMMSCLPVHTEEEGIDALLDVFSGYPQEMLDRIGAVHFHWSATADYRDGFEEREYEPPMDQFIINANSHVSKIDRHLPFSNPRCVELIDILQPEYLIHEMLGSEGGVIEDFIKQRAHFPL